MDINRQKKLLEDFLKNLDIEGVCGFWISEEEDQILAVYLIFDQEWFSNFSEDRYFVGRKIRKSVRDEIKRWFDVNVFVGSISKKCEEKDQLTESEKKGVWTEKANQCLYEVLNSIGKESFENEKDFINSVFNKTVDHFIKSTMNISDKKEIGEIYRILKNPFKKHIIKNHKELLRKRYNMMYHL
jgi:hypothetical protein